MLHVGSVVVVCLHRLTCWNGPMGQEKSGGACRLGLRVIWVIHDDDNDDDDCFHPLQYDCFHRLQYDCSISYDCFHLFCGSRGSYCRGYRLSRGFQGAQTAPKRWSPFGRFATTSVCRLCASTTHRGFGTNTLDSTLVWLGYATNTLDTAAICTLIGLQRCLDWIRID